TCFDAAGTKNVWNRPIEGLLAIVDLDEKKVIRVVESGAVPVSHETHAFQGASVTSAVPLMTALENAHAALEDGVVRWRQWSFHYRLDRRGGLIVSLLRYRDGERDRLVLYRGSLGELFVPYMDPDPNWAFRTWFDVGENDFGFMASPLSPGIDCPAGAAFLDAVLADSRGEPRLGKSVICLFERDTGAPLWRHAEGATASIAGQPAACGALPRSPSPKRERSPGPDTGRRRAGGSSIRMWPTLSASIRDTNCGSGIRRRRCCPPTIRRNTAPVFRARRSGSPPTIPPSFMRPAPTRTRAK